MSALSFPLCPLEVAKASGSIVAVLMVLVRAAVANVMVFPEGVGSSYASSLKKKNECKTRCWNSNGTNVGSRVARNIHDVFFALETSFGRAKGLTCPGKLALGGDSSTRGYLTLTDGGVLVGRSKYNTKRRRTHTQDCRSTR